MNHSKTILAGSILLAMGLQAGAAENDELLQRIEQQDREIEALKEALQQTDRKVEATADAVEQSAAQQHKQRTSIGGYAEIHYNALSNQLDGGDDKDQIDAHRYVLFVNHAFNDDIKFYSELELEHSLAGEGKPGEVELEQAFIEQRLNSEHRAKYGLFLVPVGILNETHEPDTFYGVERNSVEKNIIPTTWWEAGAGLSGEIAPTVQYDVAVHSGLFLDEVLDSDGSVVKREAKVRDGRQKVAEAKGDDYAYTGRVKYSGIQGLELAATLQYQADLRQGEAASGSWNALLFSTHAIYRYDDFELRALYAGWDIDEAINSWKDGAEEQLGYYIEPSYRVSDKIGVFARFSAWDNQAGNSADTEIQQFDIGMSYFLHERVALKVDYQDQSAPDGSDELDGINLGVGLSF